jgi:hypothetical protein
MKKKVIKKDVNLGLDFASYEFDMDLKSFFMKDIKYYIENLKIIEKDVYSSQFFNKIVNPLLISFIYYKLSTVEGISKSTKFEVRSISAIWASKCIQPDIRIACLEWLQRRK